LIAQLLALRPTATVGPYWLDVVRYGEDNYTGRGHDAAVSVRLGVTGLG